MYRSGVKVLGLEKQDLSSISSISFPWLGMRYSCSIAKFLRREPSEEYHHDMFLLSWGVLLHYAACPFLLRLDAHDPPLFISITITLRLLLRLSSPHLNKV